MVWVTRGASRVAVGLALSCSFGGAFVGGCSGNVDSGPLADDAAGGAAGRGGSSGSTSTAGRGGTGGAGGGGASGSGGASGGFAGSSAGSAGRASGGTSGLGSSGPECFPSRDDGPCGSCAKEQCCGELFECARDARCGDGGEVTCIQACVLDAVADGGVADGATIMRCSGACAGGEPIAPATNDLLACLLNGVRVDGGTGRDCLVECFSGDFAQR